MLDDLLVYIYAHKKNGRIITIKKSRSFNYDFQIESIDCFVAKGFEKGQLSWEDGKKYSQDRGTEDIPPPQENEIQELHLLKSKIMTLILFKTNVEMHGVTIDEHFSNNFEFKEFDEFSEKSAKKLYEFLRLEKELLHHKLQIAFSVFQKNINSCKNLVEVENYYLDVKSAMVLGSYTRVGKLEEQV